VSGPAQPYQRAEGVACVPFPFPPPAGGAATIDANDTARRLAEQLGQLAEQRAGDLETLQETIAELQLAAEDIGWRRLTAEAVYEFTRQGLEQIVAICRVMALKNPLIKRGLALRQAYVWGQGVEISARSTGSDPGEQDVNAVLQEFYDDPANQRAYTGHEARTQAEQTLGTDGNLFVTLFTKPLTGRVQARTIPLDQITEIITDPEDRSQPWFYRRRWIRSTLDPGTGSVRNEPQHVLYPAAGYRPASRPARMGSVPVLWDAPVVHVKTGGQLGWSFGVPDAYASVDWARAYKDFLEDWARLCRALSRFAWKVSTPGRQATMVKAGLSTPPTRDPVTGEARTAGATAMTAQNVTLDAIPKTGATLDSESGRPLAAMVAAGLGVPVTMLLGDPGVTGARATAETLDTPTELEMGGRQKLWTAVERTIAQHIIREAVRAPRGKLKGLITVDEYGRETVTLAGDTDQTVDVAWPPLDEINPAVLVTAIVQASTTGTVPPLEIARLLLQALGVRDLDEILDKLVDPDTGEFLWPDQAARPSKSAGQAAVDAYRAGQDPAAVLPAGDQPAPDAGTDPAGKPPPDEQPASGSQSSGK
jgi:hypothetical protein